MKNTIKFCVLFLTSSMLMTSCGSSLSVTKRQHNKGYFVSFNKKHATLSEKENLASKNQVAVEDTKEANQLQNDFTEASTSTVFYESEVSKNNLKETPFLDLTKTTNGTVKKTEETNKNQPRTIQSAKSNVKSTLSSLARGDGEGGHSLLWVIVVILIILWALGLIGGFGTSALLHLLLVIALVLLILWLLRVI